MPMKNRFGAFNMEPKRGRSIVTCVSLVPTLQIQYNTIDRPLYDGMRVIQQRNSGNTPTVSYTRGNDLSGSLEGVGGIGGLLARSHGYSSGSWTGHNFYHADGGGNITMLIDNAGTPNVTATYRYDPFGNSISATGTNAVNNVYRFSSKERHAGSGMYYYGYRFYDPNLQRWPNTGSCQGAVRQEAILQYSRLADWQSALQ